MLPLGLCALELRSIIEHAFLPRHCVCAVNPDQSMSVEIKDPKTGHVDLFVPSISIERLSNTREISNLIAELRHQLQSQPRTFAPAKAG
ncbi:DUF1652 domain-containing protein [Pseudomonas sp. UBA4194]|jgi:hypothetical protein|uniref:DUF1652 domain-containing protein n=1 Tax=Pseudomonas sp. UBA4194 TaxID=1947317 RepID=UPI0025D2B5DF|nr:DUF1652 domain-containing protein [Pseudomonas sp. UBA4194]